MIDKVHSLNERLIDALKESNHVRNEAEAKFASCQSSETQLRDALATALLTLEVLLSERLPYQNEILAAIEKGRKALT